MNSLFGLAQRMMNSVIRVLAGFIEYKKAEHKWITSEQSGTSQTELIGHVLVVKNQKYAQVARICIASFLHFHPSSRVVIHCDGTTIKSMKKNAKFGIHAKRVRIVCDQDSDIPWQDSKLHLILALNGSRDFVMDADLKWNGSLEKLDGVTFFVRENPYNSNKNYELLFKALGIESRSNEYMKNTSFFSWSGLNYPQQDFESLETLLSRIYKESKKLEVPVEDQTSLVRISEQLALSLFIRDSEAFYLKDTDAQFDGSFVESSYFGATGTRFSMFGVTSRW